MPQLQIPPITKFFGLDTVNLEENVNEFNTPDDRNSFISTKGAGETRNGMSKNNTSAKASPPIYSLVYFEADNDLSYDIYRDSAGAIKTF